MERLSYYLIEAIAGCYTEIGIFLDAYVVNPVFTGLFVKIKYNILRHLVWFWYKYFAVLMGLTSCFRISYSSLIAGHEYSHTSTLLAFNTIGLVASTIRPYSAKSEYKVISFTRPHSRDSEPSYPLLVAVKEWLRTH